MIRRLFALALLVVVPALAKTRAVSLETRPGAGTMVSGVVSGVTGNTIALAGGLVTIDASSAKITTDRGEPGTIASIAPGMTLVAIIRAGEIAANAPLPAISVALSRNPDVTLAGPVQSVDVANSRLTVLGRTIRVTSDTSFGGLERSTPTRGLPDILPNQVVQVQANVSGGALVATSIQVVAPLPPPTVVLRGTVKSITTTQWVITTGEGKDVSLVINAQTKISGSPKVGDIVEVVASIDTSNAYVALSIVGRVETPKPPASVSLRGTVKSIGTNQWVITTGEGKDVTLIVNAQTKISGSPKVGDIVEVVASIDTSNAYVALSIAGRVETPPPTTTTRYQAVVKSIAAALWVVTVENREIKLTITRETKIVGDPKPGDRVEVTEVAGRALSIVKV